MGSRRELGMGEEIPFEVWMRDLNYWLLFQEILKNVVSVYLVLGFIMAAYWFGKVSVSVWPGKIRPYIIAVFPPIVVCIYY